MSTASREVGQWIQRGNAASAPLRPLEIEVSEVLIERSKLLMACQLMLLELEDKKYDPRSRMTMNLKVMRGAVEYATARDPE